MDPVIVVTELRLLEPDERWGRLVQPLERELAESGLGRVVNYEALERETDRLGFCPAEEVAVELRNLGYGRELVDRVVSEAGVEAGRPVMPSRWRDFGCEEYFSGDWAERGHFDEFSQTPVVVPLAEAYEDTEHEFLFIGTSGGDGINFGFRRGRAGLWAYYPLRREFRLMAATVAELVEGWCSGRLSV